MSQFNSLTIGKTCNAANRPSLRYHSAHGVMQSILGDRRCPVQALATRLEHFVDTRINSHDPVSSLFISPQELGNRLGRLDAPLLLDVRPQARYDASPCMLAGARRCSLDDVPALAAVLLAENPHQEIIAYCTYGHHVGADAAAALRAAGLNARALAGGFEGGEDGVDDAQEIAQWRSIVLPTVEKGKP